MLEESAAERAIRKSEEIEAIKLEAKHMEFHHVSARNVLAKSIQNLMERYETEQPSQEYLLEAAMARLEAYMQLGFAYEDFEETFDELLRKLGTDRRTEFPKRAYGNKKIRLTRAQVGGLIHRWCGSRYHTMLKTDAIDDIIAKVKGKQIGRYEYHSNANPDPNFSGADYVYILYVDPEESYFYDVRASRYYTFMEKGNE